MGIPPTKDNDVDDVVWGLQTAEALWNRGERIDALVWLRRAAQAAGDAEQDERALELGRHAATLADWVANSAAPTSLPPPTLVADVIALTAFRERETQRDVQQGSSPDVAATMSPSRIPVPPPLPTRAPSNPSFPTRAPSSPGLSALAAEAGIASMSARGRPTVPASAFPESEASAAPSVSVPPADRVHAGMFDPWADDRPISVSGQPTVVVGPPGTSSDEDDEEDDGVVTSLRPKSMARAGAEFQVVIAPPAPLVPNIPVPSATKAPPPFPTRPPSPSAPRVDESLGSESVDPLTFDNVAALAELSPGARASLADSATVSAIGEGEEVSGFALAYVSEGTFDVAAAVLDAPACQLQKGQLLRARGTTNHRVPMRLIASGGSGVVMTWTESEVEAAFEGVPWIEAALRSAADRVQTLVGITVGPLGERLDASLREALVSRLPIRPVGPGELVVHAGDPVPGLMLVGIGALELVDAGVVKGTVESGEFLFPAEVLRAGVAPTTVRGGPSGALVMAGTRSVAEELLVTCPPLLEVFAGM
jgi:hypothetical protein